MSARHIIILATFDPTIEEIGQLTGGIANRIHNDEDQTYSSPTMPNTSHR